jgi:hypothetical protein
MKRLEETFPADVASFEQSFPPLCENCTPRVEEIIKKKDYDAQVNAWSMFLSGGTSAGVDAGLQRTSEWRSTSKCMAAYGWGIVVLSYLPYRCFTREWGNQLDQAWPSID